jgi:hypothetical protein
VLSGNEFAGKPFVCGWSVQERKQFNMLKKAIIRVTSCACFVVLAFVALIMHHGFPYKYMDLNDNGFVSPREALRALDMGIRDIYVDGNDCVEVFSLKDGLATKQVCS